MQMPRRQNARRAPGRPRAFDLDTALDGALVVFRQRGYHGASLSDLCGATGLTPGSIYKAFAGKRAVFLAAFERYRAVRDAEIRAAIEPAETGFGKVEALLRSYADISAGREGRCGCLVTGSAVEISTFDAEMADGVGAAIDRIEGLLGSLIREGMADGTIDASVEPDAAALHLLSVLQGFRVIGKLGRSRDAFLAAVDHALIALQPETRTHPS